MPKNKKGVALCIETVSHFADEEEIILSPLSVLKLVRNQSVYIMGICLGHQLIWNFLGCEITHSQNPIHGQTKTLRIPDWSFFPSNIRGESISVQKYNSLIVDTDQSHHKGNFVYDEAGECLMGHLHGVITYQFHPESVGTSYPTGFFSGLKKFLYNETDEIASQDRRDLRSKTINKPETDEYQSSDFRL